MLKIIAVKVTHTLTYVRLHGATCHYCSCDFLPMFWKSRASCRQTDEGWTGSKAALSVTLITVMFIISHRYQSSSIAEMRHWAKQAKSNTCSAQVIWWWCYSWTAHVATHLATCFFLNFYFLLFLCFFFNHIWKVSSAVHHVAALLKAFQGVNDSFKVWKRN